MEVITTPSMGLVTSANRVLVQNAEPGQDRPGLPPASPAVAAAVEAGVKSRRLLFPENGPARSVETWKAPLIEDKKVGEAIWSRLKELDRFLQAAERREIMARALVLLSHYRPSGNAEKVEQGLADDWAEDLGSYPLWAINEAARRWRRTKKFKPQICELIELCDQTCGDAVKERERLKAIVDVMIAARTPLAGGTQAIARTMLTTLNGGRHG